MCPATQPFASWTKATFALDTSVRCLNFRAAIKEKCRKSDTARVQRTTPTYSLTGAGSRVTPYALQVAHGQCRPDKQSYWALRVSLTSYIVLRRHYLPTASMVSRFSVTRLVNITTQRQITCSCEFYERHGIPCRHMYEILREVCGHAMHSCKVLYLFGFVV